MSLREQPGTSAPGCFQFPATFSTLITISPTSSFILNPMPYDPAQPADHSDLNSQVMRDQLNALNDKIDATPAGPLKGVDALSSRVHRATP